MNWVATGIVSVTLGVHALHAAATGGWARAAVLTIASLLLWLKAAEDRSR